MSRGTDERGVSEVVGFILLFGMLAISFTVYQGVVVPDQNRQVEFQHNQEVQGELQDLRNAIAGTAATGSTQSVSVRLGATYPTRTVAQNLGTSAGAIETRRAGDGRIVLENARAVGDPETGDYFDGTNRSFSTTSITYTPVYSFYSGAPRTTYDNTVLYNRFDSTNLTVTGQSLVDGRRITLVALNGTLSTARRDTVSLNTEPISVSSNRISVEGDGSEDLAVTIPTTLSAAEWRDVAAEEFDPNGTDPDAYVTSIEDSGPRRVTFVFERGETYDLRMAKVGVGQDTSGVEPRYLTVVSGNQSTVVAGGTTRIVLEVRDAYSNPVSGVTVNASGAPSTVSDGAVRTGADGRASFLYTAPTTASTGQTAVRFNISDSPERYENVSVVLNVLNVSGGGDGGDGEDGSAGQVGYVDGTGSAARAGSESRVDFDIENSGSTDVTITEIEIDSGAGNLRSIMESNGWWYAAGQHEVYIGSSTPGLLESDGEPYWADDGDNHYQLGTVATLTEPATLAGGEQAQVTALHFRNNGGQTVSAADKELTVTLHFQDGTSTSFSFTPPGY